MAQNGNVPYSYFLLFFFFKKSRILLLTHFLCCLLNSFGFQIRLQSSWTLQLMQLRGLARSVQFKIKFSFILTLLSLFYYLCWNCCYVQIIRNGFYQTKNVEHKGQVFLFSFSQKLDFVILLFDNYHSGNCIHVH